MNENKLEESFLNEGYSKKLSKYLAKEFPSTGFGAGWLEDEVLNELYKKWLTEKIDIFNSKKNKKMVRKKIKR